MPDSSESEHEDWSFPSPKEMRGWLEREITNIMKATELRTREATALVTAYAQGEISADEAAQRSSAYSERWGDALPGTFGSHGLSDDEILLKLDEARSPKFVDRLMQTHFGKPEPNKKKRD